MESQIIFTHMLTARMNKKASDFEGAEFERDIVLTLSLKVFRRKIVAISSGNHGRTLDEVVW
jgi:hypothetical protein